MTDRCRLCGGDTSWLGSLRASNSLGDGTVLCLDCIKKAGVLAWENSDKTYWTIEDVYDKMYDMLIMMDQKKNVFKTTAAIYRPDSLDELILAVDTDHDWWYTSAYDELFNISQIVSWSVRYTKLDLNEETSSGIHLRYTPPDPSMPVPSFFEEISGLILVINLADHPYVDKIEIQIAGRKPSSKRYKKYMDEMYGCAKECFDLLDKCVRMNQVFEY